MTETFLQELEKYIQDHEEIVSFCENRSSCYIGEDIENVVEDEPKIMQASRTLI